ncbi:hypothetical protein EBR96_00280 [bacterium]|nr:hypothetical protein [bacterium]
MRYIVCLGDGMSDLPIDELGGKTPLQVAKIPNIDRIVANGRGGLVHTVPQGLNPGSDVANMGILGYDPRQFYTGRGPIEAAAMGIVPPAGQVIFRLNLVTIQNGIMHSFTAGHVENEDGVALLDELNTVFSPDEARFFPGVSYRNIVLLPERYLPLKTAAPHDLTDKSVAAHWPHSESGFELAGFLEKCRQMFGHGARVQCRICPRFARNSVSAVEL